MNITLTGNLGSGKTNICNILEKEVGIENIKSGELFREIANERKISVVELNELAKSDKSIDTMLDERSKVLGDIKTDSVFDSRMGWFFVSDSFKVFLLVEIKEAAKRVLNDKSRKAEFYKDITEAETGIITTSKMERSRFKELYNVDYYNQKNYNLIIDTTNATADEVADTILNQYCEFKKSPFDSKIIFLNKTKIDKSNYYFDFAD